MEAEKLLIVMGLCLLCHLNIIFGVSAVADSSSQRENPRYGMRVIAIFRLSYLSPAAENRRALADTLLNQFLHGFSKCYVFVNYP